VCATPSQHHHNTRSKQESGSARYVQHGKTQIHHRSPHGDTHLRDYRQLASLLLLSLAQTPQHANGAVAEKIATNENCGVFDMSTFKQPSSTSRALAHTSFSARVSVSAAWPQASGCWVLFVRRLCSKSCVALRGSPKHLRLGTRTERGLDWWCDWFVMMEQQAAPALVCSLRGCGAPLTRANKKRNRDRRPTFVCEKGHVRKTCNDCGKQVRWCSRRWLVPGFWAAVVY